MIATNTTVFSFLFVKFLSVTTREPLSPSGFTQFANLFYRVHYHRRKPEKSKPPFTSTTVTSAILQGTNITH